MPTKEINKNRQYLEESHVLPVTNIGSKVKMPQVKPIQNSGTKTDHINKNQADGTKPKT